MLRSASNSKALVAIHLASETLDRTIISNSTISGYEESKVEAPMESDGDESTDKYKNLREVMIPVEDVQSITGIITRSVWRTYKTLEVSGQRMLQIISAKKVKIKTMDSNTKKKPL